MAALCCACDTADSHSMPLCSKVTQENMKRLVFTDEQGGDAVGFFPHQSQHLRQDNEGVKADRNERGPVGGPGRTHGPDQAGSPAVVQDSEAPLQQTEQGWSLPGGGGALIRMPGVDP